MLIRITERPPARSFMRPKKGCAKPFSSQPSEAAIEIVPTETSQSSSQVSTKTPNDCREPIARNVAKKRAPTTYQP